MSNFFLQLGAEGIRALMNIAIISIAVIIGVSLRKAKNQHTEE